MPEQSLNNLTPAEIERYALLIEEASEVIKIASKILRHGKSCFHPDNPAKSNSDLLSEEIGDLEYSIRLCLLSGDISYYIVGDSRRSRRERLLPYLHHQVIDDLPL